MRILKSRRKLGVVVVAALAAITFLAAACDPAENGKVDQLTIVGSDTTQDVMSAIVPFLNADSKNTDHDVLWNIHAIQSAAVTVPADANCGSITWHTPAGPGEQLAPNGSSAGRDTLSLYVQAKSGCVAVARSSGTPRPVGTGAGQDLPTFQYFAYALDAVGVASASSHAPSNLSLAQFQGIMNCTFTDWSQVGGSAGQIQRYWPQAGSGTRAFAQSDLLGGFDPTSVSTASCPAVKLTEENTGATINTNGDGQTAIVPFSVGQWVAQAHGHNDTRFGQKILSLNGTNPVVGSGPNASLNTAVVTESNVRLVNPTPAYPGIRFVFNVVDSSSVDYSEAAYFLGFGTDSGSTFKSELCSGTFNAVLADYGFQPLTTASDPTHNPAGSTCRLYKPS